MASTGFILAGTGANNADAGNNAWSSTGNITASDNSRATTGTIEHPNTSQYLHATNFGFAIPSGATIDGIEARVERLEQTGDTEGMQDIVVQLIKGGTRSGDNNADLTTVWSSTESAVDYGGAADLWGNTLDDTDVNASTFGVAVRCQYDPGDDDSTALVDAIWINVHYTEGGGGGGIEILRRRLEGHA